MIETGFLCCKVANVKFFLNALERGGMVVASELQGSCPCGVHVLQSSKKKNILVGVFYSLSMIKKKKAWMNSGMDPALWWTDVSSPLRVYPCLWGPPHLWLNEHEWFREKLIIARYDAIRAFCTLGYFKHSLSNSVHDHANALIFYIFNVPLYIFLRRWCFYFSLWCPYKNKGFCLRLDF